jgi:hypothetical protein
LNKTLEEIVVSIGPYLEKSGDKGESKVGGREEMVKRIEEINENIVEVKDSIKKVKDYALTNNDTELKESYENMGKYLKFIKTIENNIADFKYQMSLKAIK